MDLSMYAATLAVAFISSVLSGMAGVGGGFIMAPFWLLIGLSPAQGAATGAFMAVGMGGSSLAAFRGSGHIPKEKWLTIGLLGITVVSAIAGALLLPKFDVSSFSTTLAVITLLALPLLFIKPKNQHVFRRYRTVGLVMLALLIFISSIIMSSAFSILITLVMMNFLSLNVLQVTALRRMIGLLQSLILFILFALQGFFIWHIAIVAFTGGSLGSYIGTKVALKRGERFAKWALAVGAFAGAMILLISKG